MAEKKLNNPKYNICVLATHASDIHGPPYALVDYLLPRTNTLIVYKFPLTAADKVRPGYFVYKQGKLIDSHENKFLFKPFIINFFKDSILSVWWTIKLKRKYKLNVDYYFGCNNLLALSAYIAKPILKQKHHIFYAIDYSDTRFANKILNSFYLFIDKMASKTADFVWSNTNRTIKIRKQQGVKAKQNVLVPNGAYAQTAKVYSQEFKLPLKVIYHGYIAETKGIHNVIDALDLVGNKQFKFDIYGYGPFEKTLKNRIKKSPFKKQITMKGKIDNKKLMQLIGKYDLSVALINDAENYVRFGDAMKVKDALACNVPVLMTTVTEFSKTVDKKGYGIVVKDGKDTKQIAEKLGQIFQKPQLLKKFKKNIAINRTEFDWDTIFDRALNFTKSSKKGAFKYVK